MCCAQMLLDPMGGIVMTNDGNAILREVIWTLLHYLWIVKWDQYVDFIEY